MIRLRDVVEPYLQSTKRVLDISLSHFPADSFLHLPNETVSLRIDDAQHTETAQPNDLLLDAVIYSAYEDGFLAHLRAVLAGMPSEALAVFLLKDRPTELPIDEIQRIVESVGCLLLDVAQLAYPAWPTALVVGRNVHPHPSHSKRHPPTIILLRSARPAAGDIGNRSSESEMTVGTSMSVSMHRHRRPDEHLDERDQRIAVLEWRLEQLRASTSFRLGGALVGAALKPSSARHLPFQIVQIWKHRRQRDEGELRASRPRGAQPTQPTVMEETAAQLEINEDGRFLAGFGAPPERNGLLEIFGVVTDRVARALSGYASLLRPVPHETRLALERGAPDLILVQARALMPPGPWGHAGTPGGAVSYMQILHDLVALAQARGIPVVVWLDVPLSLVPALGPLARLADVALCGGDAAANGPRWSPGVPLRHFRPGEKSVTDKILIYDGSTGRPLDAPAARVRYDLECAGLTTISQAWSPALSDLIRQHAVALASPFSGRRGSSVSDFTLAAITSGSRLLSGLNDSLLAAFPSAVLPISNPSESVRATQLLLALPVLAPGDRRGNLRRIFEDDATPVRLAWLASELGLKHDPLADRQITVLAHIVDVDDLGISLDSLLSQSTRPGRLIISAERVPDRALDEVDALGISTTIVPPDLALSALAIHADSPWVAVWDNAGRSTSPHLLKDLAAAAECSHADAIGILGDDSASGEYGRYVQSLPLYRSLIRRDLLVSMAPNSDLGVLAERGARLFGVNFAGATE